MFSKLVNCTKAKAKVSITVQLKLYKTVQLITFSSLIKKHEIAIKKTVEH